MKYLKPNACRTVVTIRCMNSLAQMSPFSGAQTSQNTLQTKTKQTPPMLGVCRCTLTGKTENRERNIGGISPKVGLLV